MKALTPITLVLATLGACGGSDVAGDAPISMIDAPGDVSAPAGCAARADWLVNERFNDSQVTVENDVVYGTTGMTLDLYVPSAAADPCSARPMLVMVHGGGWVIGQKEWLETRARFHARRGMVVATLDYRKTTQGALCTSPNPVAAWYRAAQDLHAALQYLASRSADLKTDPTKVLLYGNSAGAFTTLDLALASPAEIATSYPQLASTEGALDAVSTHKTATYRIAAAASQAGALFDGDWLKRGPGETPPALFLLHANGDPTVPFGQAAMTGLCSGRSDLVVCGTGCMRNAIAADSTLGLCATSIEVASNIHDLDEVYGERCASTSPACAASRIDEATSRFFSVVTYGACEPQSWQCTGTGCTLSAGSPTRPLGMFSNAGTWP